jgi:pimeloyl-ACP methyl ester carboxylesterase
MPFFEHDGARLHYREEGSGPPLVLVHGFGSSELDWELQVPALKEHYRMIMPDLRGFGQSSKDVGPHSIEQFLSDLRALLTHLEIERFSLLGYSLGGAVSFAFSVEEPTRVERLVLVNTWPSFQPTNLRKKWEVFLRKTLVRMSGMDKMAKVLGKRLFPEEGQELLRATFEERYAKNDKSVYLQLLQTLPTWSVRDRIGVLTMPTLVLGAEYDYTPHSEKEDYVADMPNATLELVEGSRHGTPFDRTDYFNARVLEFLNSA